MQCQKCGHQNPDDAGFCRSCNFPLPDRDTQPPNPAAKTSKLAILSLVLGILSLPLFAIAGIPAIALGNISIIRILCSKGRLKGRWIAISGVFTSVLMMFIFVLIYRIDAPPIPNDYTINDIKSAAPEYNQSYELLLRIVDKNDSSPREYAIGLSGEDLKKLSELHYISDYNHLQVISQKIKEKEQDILDLWDKAKKGRDLFKELDSFPEIADLSEPSFIILSPGDLSYLTHLYQNYICLQSINGHHEQALNELIMLDSIFKKMSINARSLIMRLICNACFIRDYHLLNFMINNPDTPNETLWALKDRIDSISDEHTSFRNCLIFEYLTIKNVLEKTSNTPKLKNSPYRQLKYNSTLRFLRNYFDEYIAKIENQKANNQLRIWPAVYPNMPVKINNACKLDSLYYRIYNPVGFALIEITAPSMDKITLRKTELLIYSDLLKIVLNKRLGKEVDLKARAYSDKYIIDIENKNIFSPGPDGKAGTHDDIYLPINPEVLGLTE